MSTKLCYINKNVISCKKIINYKRLITAEYLIKKLINFIDKNYDMKIVNKICLSIPGVVDNESGISKGLSAIKYLDKVNFKMDLQNKYKKKVFIENDSKCAALAELKIGNAINSTNCLVLVLGTGLGGALIINKKIYKGSNFTAGELGCCLNNLDNNNFINYSNLCGMYSLQENYFRETGFNKSGYEIYLNYNVDNYAYKLINKQIYYLAKLILNISFIIDFDLVLIGGAVSLNKDFINLLKEKVYNLLSKSGMINKFFINVCKHYNDSNLLGANLLEDNYD
ncbi:putative ROK family sugar kinase [Spiroplasma turonicum]|uniref:Putative ROK family sugar kinase n=2 Tax=Spiroplasma turonicum TaxID=216946 RepID=A0A0K1P7S5_9MOLU|nr:putative ROK family sugar kinase [Spiroplasma turonicum]